MGTYLDPQFVESNGRALNPTKRNYQTLAGLLRQDENLYALCDRVIFLACPLIDSPEEFDEFYNQYKMGYLVSIKFFAVKKI